MSGKFNLKGILKWVYDGGFGQWRSAVVVDATGQIEITVSKNSWFSLTEETPILMTEMLVKEFFGVKLSTTHNSCFKKVEEDICPMWPDNIVEVTNVDEVSSLDCVNFCSVTLCCNAICPVCREGTKLCDAVEGEEKMPECIKCESLFRLNRCEVSGSVHIELENDAVLTLLIDNSVIDNLYGAGTCRLYSRKIKELTNKLMMLENFVISYTSVTKKLHSISIEEVKRCRRKYRNYNGIIKLVLLKVWKEGFVILKILELCMSIHYTETRVNF